MGSRNTALMALASSASLRRSKLSPSCMLERRLSDDEADEEVIITKYSPFLMLFSNGVFVALAVVAAYIMKLPCHLRKIRILDLESG